MQKIEFTKMHGLGNDFVIIDRRLKKIQINDSLNSKIELIEEQELAVIKLITINNSR